MMKRWAIAVVIAILLVGTTVAQSPPRGFSYSAYFLSYGMATQSVVDKGTFLDLGDFSTKSFEDQSYDFFSQRVRPTFTYVDELLEAKLGFEADWVWGSGDAADALGYGTGKHPNVGVGTDAANFLELKQAYIKTTMPTIPVTLQAGLFGLFYGGWGAGYFSEEAPQFRASYAFGEAGTLGRSDVTAYYVPVANGNTYTYDSIDGVSQDSGKQSIVGAEVNFIADVGPAWLRLTPTFWWIPTGKGVTAGPYTDGNGYVPGLGFLAIINRNITLIGSAAVPFGDGKKDIDGDGNPDDITYRGYYGYLDAEYSFGPGKVGFHGLLQSGDDDPNDDEFTALTAQHISPIAPLGGKFWFFESGVFNPLVGGNNLIYNAADVTRNGFFTSNSAGAAVLGLYGEYRLGGFVPWIGVATAFGLQDDKTTAADDLFYGVEVDASLSYKFGKWRAFVEGAYLFAGDGYENRGTGIADADVTNGILTATEFRNAWHLGFGLETTF